MDSLPLNPDNGALVELLPPEVRHHILSLCTLDGLKRMIRASPTYLRQFLYGRKMLLCSSFESTVGYATVDACAAYFSGLEEFAHARSQRTIASFLASYQAARCNARYSLCKEDVKEKDVVELVKFYLHVVNPLMQLYTKHSLGALSKNRDPVIAPISLTEELRVLRAIYRFQILCNIHNHDSNEPEEGSNLTWNLFVQIKFFGLFAPWEVEEIHCVHDYSKSVYTKYFRHVRWELNENHPRFDAARAANPTVPPQGSFNLWDSHPEHDVYLTGMISSGVKTLYHIILASKTVGGLVTTLPTHMRRDHGFLERYLDRQTNFLRRKYFDSEKDSREYIRSPGPFRGDVQVPDLTAETHPPSAWVLLSGQEYNNLCGWDLYTMEARLCGYVFWDWKRIEYHCAKWNLRWRLPVGYGRDRRAFYYQNFCC